MHRKLWLLSLAALFVFSACSLLPPKSYKIVQGKHGQKIAVGVIPEKDLLAQFPKFSAEYERFTPDAQAVNALRHFNKPVRVLVFLGTWCPDSQREVPRFLKSIDQSGNAGKFHVKLIAIDRSKQDKANLSKKYTIERVPTFVVLSQGKEVGRIVEHPRTSIEKDFVEILRTIP